MNLNDYQCLAQKCGQRPYGSTAVSDEGSVIMGQVGEAGELLGGQRKWLTEGDCCKLSPEQVREELGDLLWHVSYVATKHGLTLEEVARFNLDKIEERRLPLPMGLNHRHLLDEPYPPEEQLPRKMAISIDTDDFNRAVMSIDGVRTGDPLTDNRYEDDGYRFHDVFHLSYAAILGWSPTLRALLKRKRKSIPSVDEVEDGGRAICIEEGIAAMVFSYAERRNFLDGAEGIEYGLLRTIKDMTAHLEVNCRTEGDWERAIMLGYKHWRQLSADGIGRYRVDLEDGVFEFVD